MPSKAESLSTQYPLILKSRSGNMLPSFSKTGTGGAQAVSKEQTKLPSFCWMHTGDGGYMDEDGYIYVVDRIKDMIITGGENAYSIEVENVVVQHPAVLQCAVI